MTKLKITKDEFARKRDERIFELMILSKKGDEEAIEELFFLMKPIILNISKSYEKAIHEELVDIIQYSKLAILKAINTFNPSKTSNARIFLDRCIKKYLATEAKRYSRQKRCILHHAVSIDEPVILSKIGKEFKIEDTIQSKYPTVEQFVISKEEISELNIFQKGLSERNRRIFELYFICEYSQLEVSKIMNLTRKQTDNAIYKLRKKTKEYLLLKNKEITAI